MYVIYAEKPDMGTKIAAALDGIRINGGTVIRFSELEQNMNVISSQRTRDGYFRIKYEGEDCYVTWGFGHMVELKQAQDYNPEYKQWTNLPLPYIPEQYELKRMDEGGSKDKQFSVIERLFKKADTIICATDDDREGDLIFWYIYDYLGCKKPFKRALFNQQTQEEFRKAFAWKNLVSGISRRPVIDAGKARSAADFIVGAGPTAALTLKYNSKEVLSVGRVQTAVLNLIVQRDQEIKNFKPKPFWVVSGKFTTEDGETYEGVHKSMRFLKEEDADKAIQAIMGKRGVIKSVKKKDVTKHRPLLYNLVSLQIEANKRYGFTAEKTLEIMQALYDKGVTTYPRTDSNFLSEDMTDTMEDIFHILEKQERYSELFPETWENFRTKEYFDTSKVTSHPAITPTIVPATNKKLTEDQWKLYDMVVKSVLCMIHPNAIVSESKVITDVNGEEFVTKGAMIKTPGFYVVTGSPKEISIPQLQTGMEVDGEYKKVIGHTEPPKRFTEGTLLKAMENCGKTIKDTELREIMSKGPDGKPRSLGRPSSQASIIATLKKRKYITATGKTLNPTEKGILLIYVLPVDDLKSAEMTALWEKKLDDIEKGNLTYEAFMSEMEDKVREWTNLIINTEANWKMAKAVIDKELTCPLCGNKMWEGENSFQCSGKKSGKCGFFIVKKMCEKKIPDKAILDLINKKKTGVIKGFKSKKGDKFEAILYVDKASQSVKMKFPERKMPEDAAFKCIKCGRKLKPIKNGYGCTGYPDCKWAIGLCFGAQLDDDQIKSLLQGESVYVRGMQPKDPSKSSYSKYIILDKEDGKLKFAPEGEAPKKVSTAAADEEEEEEEDDYEFSDDYDEEE